MPTPQLAQLLQVLGHRVGIVHHDAFRELEVEQPRIEAGFGEHLRHHQRDVLLEELDRRQVDTDTGRWVAALLPEFRLPAGFAQRPFVDRNDEAVFFRTRKEFARADEAVPRALPAQERLRPGNPSGPQRDLRLVVQDELVLVDGGAQIGVEDEACARAPIHIGGIETEDLAAVVLCPVHRKVAVAQQLLHVGAVGRVHGDADAGAERDLLAGVRPGLVDGLQNAVGHVYRVFVARDAGLQDRKFVAA